MYWDWEAPWKYPTIKTNTTKNKLEIFSEEMKREAVMKGGWERKYGRGKSLVVLIVGFPSNMTRLEFKKCNDIALYCLAVETVKREGEHVRVTRSRKQARSGRG